jgi:hypothetical protein
MPHLMLYGRCLRGYAPYAPGLQSGPIERIIWWITRKRKLANLLSYIIMLIMQVDHDFGRMHNFGRMPNSSRPSRLWSTSQLQTYLLTPVAHHDSGPWTRRLPYHLSCEWLHMAGLDDCRILQPGHLVGNRLGGMHDLISVQNLRSHSSTSGSRHTMCHATKGHLACRGLRQTLVSIGTWYAKTLEDQGLWMSSQASLGSMSHNHGTRNWSHLWKTLSRQTKQGLNPSGQRPQMTPSAWHMVPTAVSTRSRTTWWKSRLPDVTPLFAITKFCQTRFALGCILNK